MIIKGIDFMTPRRSIFIKNLFRETHSITEKLELNAAIIARTKGVQHV